MSSSTKSTISTNKGYERVRAPRLGVLPNHTILPLQPILFETKILHGVDRLMFSSHCIGNVKVLQHISNYFIEMVISHEHHLRVIKQTLFF